MSELARESEVKLTSREIVGHGILDIVYIRHPVIAAYIGYVEKIETFKPYDDALEMTPEIVGPDTI